MTQDAGEHNSVFRASMDERDANDKARGDVALGRLLAVELGVCSQ